MQNHTPALPIGHIDGPYTQANTLLVFSSSVRVKGERSTDSLVLEISRTFQLVLSSSTTHNGAHNYLGGKAQHIVIKTGEKSWILQHA